MVILEPSAVWKYMLHHCTAPCHFLTGACVEDDDTTSLAVCSMLSMSDTLPEQQVYARTVCDMCCLPLGAGIEQTLVQHPSVGLRNDLMPPVS